MSNEAKEIKSKEVVMEFISVVRFYLINPTKRYFVQCAVISQGEGFSCCLLQSRTDKN